MTQYIQATKGPIPGASAAYQLYVSGLNGSDGNPGTDPTAPLATINQAWRLLPDIAAQNVAINLGAPDPLVPYQLDQLQEFRTLRKNVALIGNGAGQTGEDGFTEVDSGAAQAGSGQAVVVTSGGLVANAYRGFFIEILTATNAANVGARRLINSNTTTDIIPSAAFPAAIVAGDTFRVVRGDVICQVPTTGLYLRGGDTPFSLESDPQAFGQGPGSLWLVNVVMNGASAGAFLHVSGDVVMYGVELGDSRVDLVLNGTVRAGYDTNDGTANASGAINTNDVLSQQAQDLFSLADQRSWIGYGIGCTSASIGNGLFAYGPQCFFSGYMVNAFVRFAQRASGYFFGGDYRAISAGNGAIEIGSEAVVSLGLIEITLPHVDLIVRSAVSGGDVLDVSTGGKVLNMHNVALTGGGAASSNAAVKATGAGTIATVNAGSLSSGTVYGALAQFGARVQLDGLDGSSLVGGTANLATGSTPNTGASLAAPNVLGVGGGVADGSLIQRIG